MWLLPHKLLPTSARLSSENRAVLLPLSDLAPGWPLTETASYLTGFPLTTARTYVLMRTWLAPEMPRPGCVWTHALLLPLPEVGTLPDLLWVNSLFTRPQRGNKYESYTSPVWIEKSKTSLSNSSEREILDYEACLEIVRATYSKVPVAPIVAKIGIFDIAVFALWTQQWARLRRSFSFRTAGSGTTDISGVRFDLQIGYGGLALQSPIGMRTDLNVPIKPWEHAIVQDLLSPARTPFRTFIYKYGPDIRKGREHFAVLAEVFVTIRGEGSAAEKLKRLIPKIGEAFPEPRDAETLKTDLISASSTPEALLPDAGPLEVLDVLLSQSPYSRAFPSPVLVQQELARLWPQNAERMVSLGELAVRQSSQLGDAYIEQLATVMDFDAVAALDPTSELIRNVIQSRPVILDDARLNRLPENQLIALLQAVPDGFPTIEHIIARLLVRDSYTIAHYVLGRFAAAAVHQVGMVLNGVSDTGIDKLPKAWLSAATDQAEHLLAGGFTERARSASDLAIFAAMLGYTTPVVIQFGSVPWAKALYLIDDDLVGTQRQVFLAFLLALALAAPAPGCELLFERSFQQIHSALWSSRLSHRASVLLDPYLPHVRWWQEWDTCLRLRIAVANAYVKANLSVDSFMRLTSDVTLCKLLVDSVESSERGEKFVRRVLAQLDR
jgi:hypothetical protein